MITPLDKVREIKNLQTDHDLLKKREHNLMNELTETKLFVELNSVRKDLKLKGKLIHERLRQLDI